MATPEILQEDDVLPYILKCGMSQEYVAALQRIQEHCQPTRISVSLLPYTDIQDRMQVVVEIQCALNRKAFEAAIDRVYAPLRSAVSEFYISLVLLHDL